MSKLTKKQAEWLIQQFNMAHDVFMTQPADGMFHILDCRNIINKCTEKPFPAFSVSYGHRCALTVSRPEAYSDIINLHFDDGETDALEMNIEEFKQLAQGCQNVVDYLDSQDL